jgi:hypothetical protein
MILNHTYFSFQQLPQFSEQLPVCYLEQTEGES